MPLLDFVPTYARAITGDVEPPDPFENMGGRLDDWWAEGIATEDRESFVNVQADFAEPLSRVRSWDKQVEDILGSERGAHKGGGTGVQAREGGEPLIEVAGDFDLSGWQNTYENARIPVSAMAKVAGTDFYMEPHAAAALRTMMNAAKADGVNLSIGNTYRDYAQQAAMYQSHISGGHPAPVAKPGTSNHGWGLAVDLAAVGNEQFAWLLRNGATYGFSNPWIEDKGDRSSVEPWHWEYQGGASTQVISPGDDQRRGHRAGGGEPAYAPTLMLDDLVTGGTPAFGSVLASLMQPVGMRTGTKPSRGAAGSVTTQLRNGFADAGRPDLAKMVNTQDFKTWIDAESGWNVDSVSKYFPGHGRNFGLFQFWQGHPWTQNYLNGQTTWTADAYTQAKLVARYFPHLTPEDIRRYAEQIRAGSYSGWG